MKKEFSITEALKFGFSTVINNIFFFFGIFATNLGILVGISIPFFILFFQRALSLIKFLRYVEIPNIPSTSKFPLPQIPLPKIPAPIKEGIIDIAGKPILHSILKNLIPVLIALIITWIIFKLVRLFLELGLIKISLEFYDYQTATFASLFSQWHILFKAFVASILYMFITGIGFFLLIIPGIIWAVQFGFYQFVLVDENAGIIQSLKTSSDITKGARLRLLGFYSILFIINALAAIPMGLGLIITMPASFLAMAYTYRKLHALPIEKKYT